MGKPIAVPLLIPGATTLSFQEVYLIELVFATFAEMLGMLRLINYAF